MRFKAMIAAAALVMGLAAVSARADTYAWTAGQDNGTFTTGAASPVGDGYFLLTDFFFATADAGSGLVTNLDFTSFDSTASFNPTIDSFGNMYAGNLYLDTSAFGSYPYNVLSVAVGQVVRIVDQMSGTQGYSFGDFTVVAGLPTPPTPAAPEPSTWALMFAGVGLAGFALRSRKSVTAIA